MKKHKYSPKAAPTIEAIASGGLTHVRYAHKWVPSVIDIVCPRCGGRVVATSQATQVMTPRGPNKRNPGRDPNSTWSLLCTSCTFRKRGVAFAEVAPFFHEFGVSRCKVWAWNLDHLCFLKMFLEGQPTEGHPYHGYRTYVRGAWLKGNNRIKIAKAIGDRIANKSIDTYVSNRAASRPGLKRRSC